MADILLDTQSVPSTPSAGQSVFFVDSTAKIPCWKMDTGLVAARSENASAANQTVNAANTYLTDSDILIPTFSMQPRSIFQWKISASKTGAGIAAPIYTICIGTNRSTADTVRLTLTGPAQTAIADIGTLTIIVVVRNIGAAGVLQGTAWWDHRGTAANTTTSGTGFANDTTGHVEATSAGFDNSALGGSYVGLAVNSGTSGVWTVTQVVAECKW